MMESKIPQERRISAPEPPAARTRVLGLVSLSRSAFAEPAVLDPTPSTPPANAGWVPMELGRYRVTIAHTLAEREAACRLRFKVFNIELGEGLETSYKTGLDTDHFDLFCDQLIVEDRLSRAIVGTYRMQTGAPRFWSSAGPRSTGSTAPARCSPCCGAGSRNIPGSTACVT
jgi:hypothetical protein